MQPNVSSSLKTDRVRDAMQKVFIFVRCRHAAGDTEIKSEALYSQLSNVWPL